MSFACKVALEDCKAKLIEFNLLPPVCITHYYNKSEEERKDEIKSTAPGKRISFHLHKFLFYYVF